MTDSRRARAVGTGVLTAAAAGVILAWAGPAAAQTAAAPTFTKDVAPIFQEKCEACHRPDSIAPMSLVTYDEVRPWVRSIRTRVSTRQMPPWHIDRTVGIQQFKNDRSLTDEQLDTIVRWIDAGAPKGDPADMPPPAHWPDESVWNFADMFGGPPDLIVSTPAYTMPARAQDAWFKPVVETGLTEPRWVRAIEIRPSTVQGRRITHHALANLVQQEQGAPAGGFGGGGGLFMEWAVGKQGETMRPNSGKLMLPGSRISWDIHYSAAGEEITNVLELGIYFYPKGEDPKYRQTLSLFPAALGTMDLRPNAITVTQGFTVMQRPGRIESFQPHMHLRGKAMMMEVILPTGQIQVLSHVDNFNFNWHTSYVYADEAAPLLPQGTIIRITAWHDNTAALASNPDPNQWVGWGDRTVDEMAHAWVNVTYMDQADYEAEVAARRERTSASSQQQ